MFGKAREKEAAVSDISEARASRERGVLAQETVAMQRDQIESLAGTIRARRLRNGFGVDYQISLTPRWRNPA